MASAKARRRQALANPRAPEHHIQRLHHHAVTLGARCSQRDDELSALAADVSKKQNKEILKDLRRGK